MGASRKPFSASPCPSITRPCSPLLRGAFSRPCWLGVALGLARQARPALDARRILTADLAYVGSRFVAEVILGRRETVAMIHCRRNCHFGRSLAVGVFSIGEPPSMASTVSAAPRRPIGDRAAGKGSALLNQTDKMLGVILLGNNLVNAAAATLVSVIAIELFGEESGLWRREP